MKCIIQENAKKREPKHDESIIAMQNEIIMFITTVMLLLLLKVDTSIQCGNKTKTLMHHTTTVLIALTSTVLLYCTSIFMYSHYTIYYTILLQPLSAGCMK